MDGPRRGDDLFPRLAPIPRSIPVAAGGRGVLTLCRRAPGLCRGFSAAASRLAASFGRALTVLPVLEVLGFVALVFLLGR